MAQYDYNITGPNIEYSEWKNCPKELIRIILGLINMGLNVVDIQGWIKDIKYGLENGWTIGEIIGYHLIN